MVKKNKKTTELDRARLDKWAVYVAFTVNEAVCKDISLSLSLSLPLVPWLWAQAFWPEHSVRSLRCSLPKGGTAPWVLMAFTAGSPPCYNQVFIQHQKDTPSTWPRSLFHLEGNRHFWPHIKPRAIALPLYFFVIVFPARVFFLIC